MQFHCNTLQHTAKHCNALQHRDAHICSDTLQHAATLCNTLQHTATPCHTLQHPATDGGSRTKHQNTTASLFITTITHTSYTPYPRSQPSKFTTHIFSLPSLSRCLSLCRIMILGDSDLLVRILLRMWLSYVALVLCCSNTYERHDSFMR